VDSHASASRLLSLCNSSTNAAPLLAALGFGPLVPVSRAHSNTLGLPADLANPYIASGSGALRALVFEVTGELRPTIDAVARALADRPSIRWLLITISSDGLTAISAIECPGPRPRVSSLVVRRSAIVSSDAETACALAAAAAGPDLLVHLRWIEILGRDALGRRFFRVLDARIQGLAESLYPHPGTATARSLALICASRLLFLSFLETRGWLDGDRGFLSNGFADCMVRGGHYHQRVLLPLFFGTLNTKPSSRAARARAFGKVPFLNGGLFARSPQEKEHSRALFTDEALGDLYGELLTRFRFTAREESRSWSESAIDPEMLGKAFEGLMDQTARRNSGAFYTPQSMVAELATSALVFALDSSPAGRDEAAAALRGERLPPVSRQRLASRIDSIRILDPACGSGAFLVHVLEDLSRCRVALGGVHSLHDVRRRMLTACLFGVDVNPIAVWLCELRLWLSMAIEDPETNPMRVTALPNLDRNIRVGDSLAGDDFGPAFIPGTARKVAHLRVRYSRASGPRKKSLARELDIAERSSAASTVSRRIDRLVGERREALAAARARDLFGGRTRVDARATTRLAALRGSIDASRGELRRIRSGGALPFSFPGAYPDVYASGGFDLVIGNPPWIRTHHLEKDSRVRLRRNFQVYARCAWRAGTEAAAAGSGFASQVDSAALFIERSLNLTRDPGVVAMVVPAKLWRSLAGGGVREFLLTNSHLEQITDLTLADNVFGASVYPSTIITRRSRRSKTECFDVVAHRDGKREKWRIRPRAMTFDSSPGSPWLLVPGEVRAGFDALRNAGTRLADTSFQRPLLGVKTGCNEAFIVNQDVARANDFTLLRRVIRGEAVTRWRLATDDQHLIWTHDEDGRPLERLPPAEAKWLAGFRRELELRSDVRSARWWSLFRIESADCSRPRVVWADIGRSLRAAVIPAGDTSVPLNTCYSVRCPTLRDAFALAALMNSDVISAWLSVIAEPARGGYQRYMGWTIALMPFPGERGAECGELAEIGESAFHGAPADAADLSAAVSRAFGVAEAQVQGLIAWAGFAS
jgi:hypothetical protein